MMKKKGAIFWDFIVLLRPTLLVPVWTFFLLGDFWAKGGFTSHPIIKIRFHTEFIISIIAFSLMKGGVYILNQIIDRASDKENKKLFLISEGYIRLKSAIIEMVILWIISFSLILKFPLTYKIIFIISFIMGILYSLPPIQLKAKPFLDLIANAGGYGILNFSIGYLTQRGASPTLWFHTIPYFLAVGAVFINTTIPDIPGDKSAGEITTGVFLGEKGALLLSLIFIIGSIASSYLIKDWICLTASVLAFPFFIIAYIHQSMKSVLYSIRITAPILVIITSILYPLFIVVLLCIFLGLKFYYKRRFNFNYPGVLSGYNP